jgi:hypothetical protein
MPAFVRKIRREADQMAPTLGKMPPTHFSGAPGRRVNAAQVFFRRAGPPENAARPFSTRRSVRRNGGEAMKNGGAAMQKGRPAIC